MIARFPRRFVFLGRSITSHWDDSHAPVYRTLLRALVSRGHHVLFLERESEGTTTMRDRVASVWGEVQRYSSVEDLRARFTRDVRTAHCVVLGSSVAEGDRIAQWIFETARGVRAFYDFDTPATLASVEGRPTGASPRAGQRIPVGEFDLYLSLTGGPLLDRLSALLATTYARSLHCSFDPAWHAPMDADKQWDLGYVATDAPEERPVVERLMLEAARRMPAKRFVVSGSISDDQGRWPTNVRRIAPVTHAQQREFYAQQRFALNLTPDDAKPLGHTPHSRLFEAAACGTPIITDHWNGLERLFEPGSEVLVAASADDVLQHLCEVPDPVRKSVSARARRRLLRAHTPRHRAEALERYVEEAARTERCRAS
jgi:spore maturation protein CgeB